MYLLFRLLSLVALLCLIAGFILKLENWPGGINLLRIGFAAAIIGWLGRLYLDRKNKARASK